MVKWDVWELAQDEARNSTDPSQPNDATKPRRYYIIISPNAYLKTAKVAVCIPIQTVSDGSCFSVLIHGKPSRAGIHYDSYARCTDYYTLAKNLFKKRMGHLTKQEVDKVEAAIKDFYELI
jgi:mRNA-degrading endonuclease toxin of MazEF toxin-antitoxin module